MAFVRTAPGAGFSISSQLTTWGKNGFPWNYLLYSSVVQELRWSSPLRTASYAGAASEEMALWRGAPPEF
jgi:hypothetical protein